MVMLVGALVCLLVMLGYFAQFSYRNAVEAVEVETRNLTAVIESRLSSEFSRVDGMLAFVVREIRARPALLQSPQDLEEQLAPRIGQMVRTFPELCGIYIFDAAGEMRLASTPGQEAFNIADRPHFLALRDDSHATISFSDLVVSRATHLWSLVHMRSIRDEQGRFLGVVAASIQLERLTVMFRTLNVGSTGVTQLRRSDNFRLIGQIPQFEADQYNQVIPPSHPVRQRIESGEKGGTLTLIDPADGKSRIASFLLLPRFPLYVQVSISEEDYLAGWRQQATIAAGVAIVLLFVFGAAIWHLHRTTSIAGTAARNLRLSEARFRHLAESSPSGIWQADSEGRLAYVSPRWSVITGIGIESARQWGWNRGIHPADRDRVELAWQDTVAHNALSFQMEFRLLRPDGSVVWVLCLATSIREEGDIAPSWIGTFTDISHQIAMREALRANEDLKTSILDAVPATIAVLDFTGRIIETNAWWRRYASDNSPMPTGAAPNTQTGANYLAVCDAAGKTDDNAAAAAQGIRDVIDGRQARFDLEYPCPTPTKQLWYAMCVTPLGTGSQGVVVSHTDITERHDAHERLRKIASHVPGMVYQYQRWSDGRHAMPYASDGIESVFGVSAQSVVEDATPVFRSIHPDDLSILQESIGISMRDLSLWRSLFRVHHPDGRMLWAEGESTPELQPDGSVVWHGYIRDISERKQLEDALTAERELFVGGPVGVLVWRADEHWTLEYASANIHIVMGYQATEMTDTDFRYVRCVHPDDLEQVGQEVAGYLADPQCKTWEQRYRIVWPDGSVHWLYDFTVAERDASGHPLRLRGYVTDQTEQHRASRALEENMATLQLVVDTIPQGIFWKDPHGRYLGCNRVFSHFAGMTDPIDIIGQTDADLRWPPTIAQANRADDYIVLTTNRPKINAVEQFPTESGGCRWVQSSRLPLRDPSGRPFAVLGVFEDITERQQAEAAIRHSEQRLNQAQRMAQVGNWELDVQTNILTWSDEIFRIFEIDKARFGASYEAFLNIIHPDDRDRVHAAYTRSLQTREPYGIVHRLLLPDGRVKHVREQCETYFDSDGKALRSVGTVQDVTDRTLLEQQLVDDRQRLTNILWGTGVGTWEWNVQTGEMRFNERWAALIGYKLEEVGPQDINAWLRFVHPDDLADSQQALDRHFRGESEAYEHEARMRHKDGRWVWVLDRGRVNTWTQDGRPLWMAGTHYDITARKDAEAAIHDYAQALLRSNKELEQFSYSISHDMRQPLRMISSYLQLLQLSLGDSLDEEKRTYFGFAVDGAKRLDSMLMGLLEYSRVGRKSDQRSWVDSRTVLDDALLFLRPLIAEAQAHVHIEGDWPRLYTNPDEMLRLLQNLVANALKFRIAERPPVVDIEGTVRDGVWKLCVTDNGVGIAPEQIGRLFQVFQRLQSRADYEGTGIGLALCRKIVEHHGGRIWVSSPGERQGSSFCFDIPLAAMEEQEAA
ncbi:PAS/PAC domain protein [Candidatus Symbiobacter mobilis CR]|uniref:histidine kinase n=2 Tax=Candidatus Symbiobacter TaxID=1436289 RepID=U5NEM2_9BURK|nr:PAS/PAC domain protein [Candidatus Symbiobacter mobilis CR]